MAQDVTPHGAALALLHNIAWAEGKRLDTTGGNADAPSREWILYTYAQCLETIMYPDRVGVSAKWKIPE
jgi:hypothetical protein